MTTLYVVVKLDWEYNDEIYIQPEGEGYNAIRGYREKKDATAECDRLNGQIGPYKKQINYNTDDEPPEFAVDYKVISLEVED